MKTKGDPVKKINKRATYPELEALYWQLSSQLTKREQALMLFCMGKDPAGSAVAVAFSLPEHPAQAAAPTPAALQLSLSVSPTANPASAMTDDEPAV